MIGTLPLQPGSVRLMLIRDVDTGAIVDAEVFFDGDEASRARDSLMIGLDGEFRDYRPEYEPPTDEGTGPGLRLIEARSRLRRAELATLAGEAGANITESWAGSEAARAAYAELTEAARELVSAQDAFDAYCALRRIEKFGGTDART